MAAELPAYINEGYILILKGMDKIYGLLQEILNMRYKTVNEREKSKLIYDDKERDVFIGAGFRCIVIQEQNTALKKNSQTELSGESYAPFQNRLEKYIIDYKVLSK